MSPDLTKDGYRIERQATIYVGTHNGLIVAASYHYDVAERALAQHWRSQNGELNRMAVLRDELAK